MDIQSPAGGSHLASSPVAEETSFDISIQSFFRAVFPFIPLKAFGWSPSLEEFSEFEHYPMCEYFDTKTCNCGGKPYCNEESSKSRHFKMCEFFDSMPCNCGGIDEKSKADVSKSTETTKDVSNELREDSQAMKERSFKAPDVTSHDTSPVIIHETEDDDVLTVNDNLLKMIQRVVDNCLKLNDPHLNQFKSRIWPKISTDNKDAEAVSAEEIDNRGHQGADAKPYTNLVDTFLERVSKTAYPRDSILPVKGSDSEHIESNGETSANDHETVNSLSSCTDNDIEKYSLAPTLPFSSFTSRTFQKADILRLSQRISDLIQTYETNMRSDKHRVLNENVGHLNMDKEFIERLNTLLSEGYKVRYYSANLYTGNLLPTFPINDRNITKPFNYDDENNKEFELHSEEAISVHSDYDITVSSKKLEFVDNRYKARESQPNNLHDDLNGSEKVSESAGKSTEMSEKGSEKDCEYKNTGNEMVDSTILLEVSKSEYLEEESKSQYLEEESKSQYLKEVSESEYLEEEHKSRYVEEEPKSDYLNKEPKLAYVEDESKSEYLEDESKSGYLEEDSYESFFDLSERDIGESEYLEKESKSEYLEEDSYESLFDISERDIGNFVNVEEESKSEYLEKNSHESFFDLSERDIGSPCHNSSFKDNSPYTTAETVPFQSLQACGDGAMYYTLTRRSPFSEAGLNDLSADMSARDSERSIFDVSDINSSISFDRDAGVSIKLIFL